MTRIHFLAFATASAFVLGTAATQPATAGSLTDSVRDTVGGVTGSLSRDRDRGSTSSSSSSSSSRSADSGGYGGHKGGGYKGGGHKSGSGITVKLKTNLFGGTGVEANALNRKGVADVEAKSGLFGGTRVDANVLSKRGVANVKAKTGLLDTRAKVGVLNKDGVASAKVSVGSLKTRASVNVLGKDSVARLGVSIGGGNGGGGNGGGNGGGGNNGTPVPNGNGVLAGMSDGQIAALKVRCVDILGQPRRYDSQLVALCSILQQI